MSGFSKVTGLVITVTFAAGLAAWGVVPWYVAMPLAGLVGGVCAKVF
jgi:hypothetical protein